MEKQALSYSGIQNSRIPMEGNGWFLSKFKCISPLIQNSYFQGFFLQVYCTMLRRMHAQANSLDHIYSTKAWRHTKNRLTVHFQRVDFMACKLYVNWTKRWEAIQAFIHRGGVINHGTSTRSNVHKAIVNENEEAPVSEIKSSLGLIGM